MDLLLLWETEKSTRRWRDGKQLYRQSCYFLFLGYTWCSVFPFGILICSVHKISHLLSFSLENYITWQCLRNIMHNERNSCKHKAPLQLISSAVSSVDFQGFGETEHWQANSHCWMSSLSNEPRKALLSTASGVAHMDWIVNETGVKLPCIHPMVYYVGLI